MSATGGDVRPHAPKTAVFGATGFIGRHLIAALRLAHPDTPAMARAPGEGLRHFDLVKPDISLLRLAEEGVTHAVIAAAVSGIAACERDLATRAVNVAGTVELARQLAWEGIKVITFSSDYVFDGVTGRYDECAPVAPVNEYGRQKAEMEAGVLKACGTGGLVIRLSKVFDLVRGSGTLLDEMASRLTRGEEVSAARDQVFCPTHVDDMVGTVLDLLESDTSGILHLCAPTRTSRLDLARQVAATIHCDPGLVREISLRDLGEPFARPLDTSMICPRLTRTLTRVRLRDIPTCLAGVERTWTMEGNKGP